jgi:uncharacterized membrane protein YbhN (UPF0104 family)
MTNGEETSTRTGNEFISIRKLIAFVLIGAVVYLAILFYVQVDPVIAAISSLPYWILPAMISMSFLNYLIRYVKWQYYLRRIDVNLSRADSLSIFLAGFTLTTTPGKMGEAVKGVFINDIDGTPLAKTAPVVVSERATDLIAMVILALAGFTIGFAGGDQLYLVVLLGAAAVVGAIILGRSEFYDRILQKLTSFGPLKRFSDNSSLIADTMTKTMSPKPMAVGTAISVGFHRFLRPRLFCFCRQRSSMQQLPPSERFPSCQAGSSRTRGQLEYSSHSCLVLPKVKPELR